MKELRVFDKRNYDRALPRHIREAVRAVILREDKILLVKSMKQGYYKFPGGGCEDGETHLDTIIRETEEETGHIIRPETVREMGVVRELRKDLYRKEIFEQISYYYYADVAEEKGTPSLDAYEAEEGFIAEVVPIHTALEVDRRMANQKHGKTEFLKREAYILELVLRNELLRHSVHNGAR